MTIYTALFNVLNHLDTCLPDSANLQKLILYCDETPQCPSYIAVSSPGVRFAQEVGGPAGTIMYCASIILMPISVAVAGVCIPQPRTNGSLPTAAQESNARRAAYQQMENLAGCLSTLTFDNCTYHTRPDVTCDIEGTSYIARATFEITLNCFEPAPTGAPCC